MKRWRVATFAGLTLLAAACSGGSPDDTPTTPPTVVTTTATPTEAPTTYDPTTAPPIGSVPVSQPPVISKATPRKTTDIGAEPTTGTCCTHTPLAYPNGNTVHPGAFCSPLGATGTSTKGTLMRCSIAADGKKRWKTA